MKGRIASDAFGEMIISAEKNWGPQTQRSLENFSIGEEKMPILLIRAYALIKKAAALTNAELNLLDQKKAELIVEVCEEIEEGDWDAEFPLSVWQTGSGTQTNMNVNEVIANLANKKSKDVLIHPNDDVNLGQSTNDTFPTAIHIAGMKQIETELHPVLDQMVIYLSNLEEKYKDTIKLGRTHLQDATPITFGQEVSAWKEMIIESQNMIVQAEEFLAKLPIGGTAVGTGLNAAPEFSKEVVSKLKEWTGLPFTENKNKFHGLSSKDAIVHVHNSLNVLAINAMKIANDIRWLASGPRSGLGEIQLPENEPGSSIMPGKVNPTQAEALTMVCVQVMGNNTTIGISASQGNFELNVYMPVIAYNFLQSIKLLSDGLSSFGERCLKELKANEFKMLENVENSLALATALTPHIGYEKASLIVQKAYKEDLSLKEAAVQSGLVTAREYEQYVDISKMI